MKDNKGFTLVELLIVIGILAVLATTAVIVLNPVELLKQARDSQRLSDLDSVRSATSLYLADVTSPSFTAGPFSTASTTCAFTTCTLRAVYTIAGSGWAAVDLSAITGGSPLSVLPRDPTNSGLLQYAWKANSASSTFEIDAQLESAKYTSKMTTDGGDSTSYYEVGNDPGLDL